MLRFTAPNEVGYLGNAGFTDWNFNHTKEDQPVLKIHIDWNEFESAYRGNVALESFKRQQWYTSVSDGSGNFRPMKNPIELNDESEAPSTWNPE